MAETKASNEKIDWMTVRIERTSDSMEMERFFFRTKKGNKYYIDLRPSNRSSELVAVSLVRDAYARGKRLNIWYETRANRRWVKALNLHG